jgi:hypothetical protein
MCFSVRIRAEAPNMHRYQSGLMAWSAKPSIREFESHPMLHVVKMQQL